MMIDDALTEKQEPTSKIVGLAQGLYSVAAQRDHELALLVVMNFAFVEAKYKGSTISILGRNPMLNDVREMPIIGRTGLFRFARGYALAHTVRFNPTGDANVEYNAMTSTFSSTTSYSGKNPTSVRIIRPPKGSVPDLASKTPNPRPLEEHKGGVSEQCNVGGKGQFRLDPGYVLDHTVWFDASTGDAIVESNVYVSH
ncbi:Disease resistance-responsive dirigent-like family protein [Prunus dulcis]|uniref:Dirigent protein n=1 Tax=Prunus dulcis TaxID=3755 RepID=A0A4Y1QXB6_PRUDU|nr:Disease resistance-responsive dirigent-like family protein [Prunus dulcis]